MSEIHLNNIRKEYGDLVAVDGIDITIPDNSYTMILGPSGCGKSTTLRMIAGLEQPTSGDIYFGDERVTDKSPRNRGLSMVFQDLALWDHKSVRENIEFGLKMDDVPKEKRRERTQEIAETLKIEDKLDDSPTSLSGGQQQRVALGRSLVREPEVILLDEPLSSLDAKLQVEMRTELLRIQQKLDISFVHVTHNQEDAMSIADEIILLNDGKIQQFGSPIELFEDPSNRFVGEFIGTPSMNLFEATFETAESGSHFATDDFNLEVPESVAEDFETSVPDGSVEVGVRPSNLDVVEETQPGLTHFTTTVSVVETYGDNNWYYLDTNLEAELILKSADDDVIRTLSEGDEVTVGIDPENIHIFDISSGEAYR